MRVHVATTHSVTDATTPEEDDNYFQVFVDSDGTAQVRFEGHKDSESDSRVKSRWLDSNELRRLRALISRAIGLLDDTD